MITSAQRKIKDVLPDSFDNGIIMPERLQEEYHIIISHYLDTIPFHCETCGSEAYSFNGITRKPFIIHGQECELSLTRIICKNSECRQTYTLFTADMIPREPFLLDEMIDIQRLDDGDQSGQDDDFEYPQETVDKINERYETRGWRVYIDNGIYTVQMIRDLCFLKDKGYHFLQMCRSIRIIFTPD